MLSKEDFPHNHSLDALVCLRAMLEEDLAGVEEAIALGSRRTQQQACENILEHLDIYLPVIGFLRRSKNIRNAFEFHAPLLSIARDVIGPDAKLCVSSEWEFSPFTYRPLVHLANFVLIGLPASESGSSLILPSAAHELGHHVWDKNILNAEIQLYIKDSFQQFIARHQHALRQLNVFGNLSLPLENPSILVGPSTNALNQCQELFCDFVGVRMFGISFLDTLHYLLAPGDDASIDNNYPALAVRASANAKALKDLVSMDPPDNFLMDFASSAEYLAEAKETFTDADSFHAALVHNAVIRCIEPILRFADTVIPTSVPRTDPEKARDIYQKSYRLLTPACGKQNLADICNAGWLAYHDPDLWSDMPGLRERKNEILNDLVLKTIEVTEFEHLTSGEEGDALRD